MIHLVSGDEAGDPSSVAAIGIDIGGTNHTAALVGPDGELLEVLRGKTDAQGGPEALLTSLERLVPELIAEAGDRSLRLLGLGVGFGGPVDFHRGVVLLSHHVPGWEDYPLRERLEYAWQLPVALDNDANAGGWGEFCFGAGRGVQDLVYYNIGTGIGGAVVLDGRLRRGPATIAGELGHTTVRPGGPLCTCGQRGCLEALAAGRAIDREVRELGLEWDGRPAVGTDLFPMVAAKHPGAIQVRNAVVDALSLSIRNVLHTLNPEMVVIGGGVAAGGDLLLDPLRDAVKAITFEAAFRCCRIELARFGYGAGVVGAAGLILKPESFH